MKNSQFCFICGVLLVIAANTSSHSGFLAVVWAFGALVFFILAVCAKD